MWGPVNAEIIGVVGDVHQTSLGEDPKPGLFLPTLQFPTSPVNIVVRTHGDPKQLANAIQAQIHSLDRDLPISDIKTMDEYVASSVSDSRFNTILLAGFAALALVMACVGIFGVVSYSVAQRTREIGVRRALGADAGSVMRMVLTQGMIGQRHWRRHRARRSLRCNPSPDQPPVRRHAHRCCHVYRSCHDPDRWSRSWPAFYQPAAQRKWILWSPCDTSKKMC